MTRPALIMSFRYYTAFLHRDVQVPVNNLQNSLPKPNKHFTGLHFLPILRHSAGWQTLTAI